MIDLGDPLSSLSAHLKHEGLLAPELTGVSGQRMSVPEATTIVGLAHSGGQSVTLAADRRASAGNRIVKDDMTKLFLADRYSAIGIAGAAGLGIEFARLFALELEHVEKIEGRALSHEGKIRRLGLLVRAHLQLAMQGLVAVPLLAGFDERAGTTRLHTFDATGGVYEERDCAAIGSGSDIARAVLESRRDLSACSQERAHALVLEALAAAARRDSATSGVRGEALPVLVEVDASGARFVSSERVSELVAGIA
ncbi:proteasome subunit beta [Dermabacter sp. p3-SID358]|uniref:proteasome subunit beta n=1 Tax=Dermabacter sp. p3-SID358 TaxID=2916114 RepID=UPI0021A742D8|nr:proteasome subunit beta [Dermabacter sp. p3-SID358]MCT1866049.1 proteasome subunit beta [Dermabacter sp. p3-SID358]